MSSAADVYDGLKKTFLATWKGRRPDPPAVPLTNLLFLMLHCLRLEGSHTLKAMSSWFLKLVPDCRLATDRVSKRIDRVVTTALSLGTSALHAFAELPININSISESLDSIGLNIVTISDLVPWSVPITVMNEMMMDMEFCHAKEKFEKERICVWFRKLTGLGGISSAAIRKKLDKLCESVKVLRRIKAKNAGRLQQLLKEPFTFIPDPIPSSTADPVTVAAPVKGKTGCSNCEKHVKELSRLNHQFIHELETSSTAKEGYQEQVQCLQGGSFVFTKRAGEM